MYTRPQGRFPREMRIPGNYSGNALRGYATDAEPSAKEEAAFPTAEGTPVSVPPLSAENATENDKKEKAESVVSADARRGLPFGFRFGAKGGLLGGIGFEELLLIGLILLLAEEGENDDLILLFVLLLFIQ